MKLEMASLAGRVALVTGGGAGIGAAIVRCFASFGASVVIADIDVETMETLRRELETHDAEVLAVPCDVRDQAEVDSLFGAIRDRFGRLDVLVNNVGGVERKMFLEMTEDQWLADIDLNLVQAFRCTRSAAKWMIEQDVRGSIINMTTIEGYRAAPGYGPYAAAKAGLANFTKTMALELAPWGIRVNSIAPDATMTPGIATHVGSQAAVEDTMRGWGHIARNRRGRPEDYGGAAIFLASDLSGWITGEVIHVGGGTFAAAGWRRDEEGYWNNGGPAQAYSGRPLRESKQD